MKQYPVTKVVFDRKHEATDKVRGLVQIEVRILTRKMYVGTGVHLLSHQWSPVKYVQNSFDADIMRRTIDERKASIDGYILSLMEKGIEWDWNEFKAWLKEGREEKKEVKSQSFYEFVFDHMRKRKDISELTRRQQRKILGALKEFGMTEYAQLTRPNIHKFDDWLHEKTTSSGQPISDAGVYNYHKVLKSYINLAIERGKMETNPYTGIKIRKGDGKMKGWLTEEEMSQLAEAEMPTPCYERVRDFALLQYYTGLAYADLFSLEKAMFRKKGRNYVLTGERQKTGVGFYVVLLPDAVRILEKYKWVLPSMSNQKYNQYLKVVFGIAGVHKPVSSHWLRRSAGMYYLNHGMTFEVVAKILGHNDVRTTQRHYAHLLDKAVDEAFDRLMGH